MRKDGRGNLLEIISFQTMSTAEESRLPNINLQEIGRGDTYTFTANPYDDVELTPTRKNSKFPFMKNKTDSFEERIAQHDLSKRERRSPKMHYKALENRMDTKIEAALKSVDESNERQNPKEKMILHSECYAPPGKLGVAIDTINGQPIVHRLKAGSPLEGVLRRLDKIIAIDDVDTSSMSAADVTHLMVKKMNQKRKISFIRGHTGQSLLGNSD